MYKKPKKFSAWYPSCFLSIVFIVLNSTILEAQPVAGFTAADTLGCSPFTVQFTNTSTCDGTCSYLWTASGAIPPTSTNQNQTFTFPNGGNYSVTLRVTNTSTFQFDELTKVITVIQTPSAYLNIIDTNACAGGNVEFRTNFQLRDSVLWNFGDGSISKINTAYMFHSYQNNDDYTASLITYYSGGYDFLCSDTSTNIVTIAGPVAEISMSPPEACKGVPIQLIMNEISDVENFSWIPEEDVVISNTNPATHVYYTTGYLPVFLYVTGLSGNCLIQDTLHIYEVEADFEYSDIRCHNEEILFTNFSTGNAHNFWDLGNGGTSLSENPVSSYEAGNYTVRLIVENNNNCNDTLERDITVHPKPIVEMIEEMMVCPGVETTLQVSGGDVVHWEPASAFDDPDSYNPSFIPESSATYYATVTDNTSGCTNSDSVAIYVQPGFVEGKITVFPLTDSIIIGDTVYVTFTDSLHRQLTYNWSPSEGIGCTDCPNPYLQPLTTTTYTLVVSDTNQCFMSESFEIAIVVDEQFIIGLPAAFTPNNDFINDIIKVEGWGIQELIEFRIYNRSGIEVYNSNDLSSGWDGNYKAKPQNIGTYSYVVKALMYNNNIMTKQGTFSLIR